MPLAWSAALLLSWLTPSTRADLWVTGYYPGYEQSYLTPSNIDFSALTHIIHFSIVPNANGTLDPDQNVVTPSYSTNLVARAHAAGKKVLISIGGAGGQTGFLGASTPANLPTFIQNLTNFVAKYNYDGIDIDWEPLPVSSFGQYTNLIIGLRAALNAMPQPKLLTAAVGAYPYGGDSLSSNPLMFASIQNKFDQINLMTYDLSGPYGGWVTWYNGPLYDGNYRFASTGSLVPSTEGAITNFIGKGVAPGKLGIGIAFYGYIWGGGAGTTTGGVSAPRQAWTTAPTTFGQMSYDGIMTTYYQSNRYHWDSGAQAAYLGIDNAGSADDKFISYDDEHTCQAKVSYARNRRLGGVMIWELAEGYRSTQPAGKRDPLLQSIKQAIATPGAVSAQRNGPDLQISFSTVPLGLYRVQWTTDVFAPVWNTLTNNVPGTNGMMQVTDPGAANSNSPRFYRVQTPP